MKVKITLASAADAKDFEYFCKTRDMKTTPFKITDEITKYVINIVSITEVRMLDNCKYVKEIEDLL